MNLKRYPSTVQFFAKSEFKPFDSSALLSLQQLQEIHYLLLQYAESLKFCSERDPYQGMRIIHQAMTIFHVYIKKRGKLEVDLKLVLLSCLRISAVIGDLELS